MSHPSTAQTKSAGIDLLQIAQRILKLAEISVMDHLEAVDRSQAVGLSKMLRSVEEDNCGAERCR